MLKTVKTVSISDGTFTGGSEGAGASPKSPVSWPGVVARVHLFFDRLLCTKKIGQSGPAITSANFSKAVWRKFSEVAPTVQNGAKPFLVFIQVFPFHETQCFPRVQVATQDRAMVRCREMPYRVRSKCNPQV